MTVACGIHIVTGDSVLGDGDAPVVLGLLALFIVGPLAVFTTALVASGWRRTWLRLDSTGVTHRDEWLFRRTSPKVYSWTECGPFTLRDVPVSAGPPVRIVESTVAGRPVTFTLVEFGDPRDLVTIFESYRSKYETDAETVPDADAARLEERTWKVSAFYRYGELIVIAAAPVVVAVLMLVGVVSEAGSTASWVLGICSAAILLATSIYVVRAVRNPRSMSVDPDGFTVTGGRLLSPGAPPRRYRWHDCGPFELHVIHDEVDRVVARCWHPTGYVTLERWFGDPHDLVTVLNGYRSAARS